MTVAVIMAALHTIWGFISLHWHKIVGVIAFFFAAYNKWQHNKLLGQITELIPKTLSKNTKKISKSKKSKK